MRARRAPPDPAPFGEGIAAIPARTETRLTVLVHPRAGRNEIVVLEPGSLRVRVTAPPANGAANEAVRDLLARALQCARSDVEILRGHTARTKVIRVAALSWGDVRTRLAGAR